MSLRKRGRIERLDYPHRCPACFAPMLLTFDKPSHGTPSIVTKTCTAPDEKLEDLGCGSKFMFIIKKQVLVDKDGKELPMTITRKVVEMTEKGAKAFKAKTTHKLADRMGGGG
jgi:hypothetical protein